MIEDFSNYIGDEDRMPYDLLWARRDVLDYHKLYGMPAVIKRAYNSDHIAFEEGPHGETVTRDQTYDDVYGQGFDSPTAAAVNGRQQEFSSGWFTYITIIDTNVDASDPGERGAHKTVSSSAEMPWAPLLWEGDLIILVEINKTGSTIDIVGAQDRFVVNQVNPISMRGDAPFYIPRQETDANFYQDNERFISQQFQLVRMPRYSDIYDVPILG